MQHWHILLGILVLAGVLGGVVNYLLITEEDRMTKKELLKSILIGVAASLLVPLFFNTISSNIIIESEKEKYKLFVIAGFCLIAAISAKPFIQSISSKLLRDLNEVKNEVQHVKNEVKTIVDSETEDEVVPVATDAISDGKLMAFSEKDTDKIKILRALTGKNYTYRSLQGLSRDTQIAADLINNILNDLFKMGYVNHYPREKGIRFYITTEGRKYLSGFDTTYNARILE